MDKLLRDVIVNGSESDLRNNLDRMKNAFVSVGRWVTLNCQRNDKNLALYNLLSSIADYISVLVLSINEHISVASLATRNIYEINLRVRAIIDDEKNVERWNSEAIIDKQQLLEGILGMKTASEMKEQRKVLRKEIDRIISLRKKFGLPEVKSPEASGEIAKKLGLSDEHKNLYKLFSKTVHPSSYLVNDYTNAASVETRDILQVHAQLYAWDVLGRICDHLGIPSDIYSVERRT